MDGHKKSDVSQWTKLENYFERVALVQDMAIKYGFDFNENLLELQNKLWNDFGGSDGGG